MTVAERSAKADAKTAELTAEVKTIASRLQAADQLAWQAHQQRNWIAGYGDQKLADLQYARERLEAAWRSANEALQVLTAT